MIEQYDKSLKYIAVDYEGKPITTAKSVYHMARLLKTSDSVLQYKLKCKYRVTSNKYPFDVMTMDDFINKYFGGN